MNTHAVRLRRNTAGAATIEYALLLSLVGVLTISAVSLVGIKTSTYIADTSSKIHAAHTSATEGGSFNLGTTEGSTYGDRDDGELVRISCRVGSTDCERR